jgi:predicted transcriptional regulator
MLHMSQNSYNQKIVEILLKSDDHVRGLAKSLGTNQTTIARKVIEMSKDNIVDFKTEGRNKVVFL